MIGGNRYCDNFIGYQSFHKIDIDGKYAVMGAPTQELTLKEKMGTGTTTLQPNISPERAIVEPNTKEMASTKLSKSSQESPKEASAPACVFFDGYMQGGVAKQTEDFDTEDACAMHVKKNYPGASGATWIFSMVIQGGLLEGADALRNGSCYAELGTYLMKSSSIRTCSFKGWLQYPNYCASSSNVNLDDTNHPDGDTSVEKCKSDCNQIFGCSAIEWYSVAWNGSRCKLHLEHKGMNIPATKGFEGTRWLDATCYIKPDYIALNGTTLSNLIPLRPEDGCPSNTYGCSTNDCIYP